MTTVLIILGIAIIVAAIILLTLMVKGVIKDENNNLIPDNLEDIYFEVESRVQEIKAEYSDVKKAIEELKHQLQQLQEAAQGQKHNNKKSKNK